MKIIGKKILVALIIVTSLSIASRAFFKGHHSPGGWGLQSGTQVPISRAEEE